MDQLTQVVTDINGVLWGFPLMALLAGFGIISTIYLGFPQIKYFGRSWKQAFGGMFSKEAKQEGSMSSFQSLATAIAAQVGTGNIGGVGTAIVSGGPGAVFWMWVLALLGMSTISVEAILAQKYREKRSGQLVGGPAYYIKHGLENKGMAGLGKFLAGFFAIMIIIALGLVGNMVQSNSISGALNAAFGFKPLIVGIILAVIAALIFIGGMDRIAKFTELVVPIMALVYILGSIFILIKYGNMLGETFAAIFKAAFTSEAVLGGVTGYAVKLAIRYGIARGLFSNEAGMGSTPNSHAVADVKHPVQQALVAMVGVFIDTVIVCSATALVILVTGANNSGAEGVGIAMAGFQTAFGNVGAGFLAVALTAFAFTTVVGWYYFGEGNVKFLFRDNKIALRVYQILVFIFIVVGASAKVEFVWQLADLCNGLMVIPNVIGLFLLLSEAKALYQDYERQMESGQPLTHHYGYENL